MKKLSESVWADIHRRSNGEQTRKEDDINLLDIGDFFKYLNETYVTLPNHNEPSGTFLLKIDSLDTLNMLVLSDDVDIYRLKIECFSEDDRYITLPVTENLKKDQLYKRLKENYDISKEMDVPARSYSPTGTVWKKVVKINPKNGKVSNSFFIELIDFILENVGSNLKKEIIKK